jgi:dipeptidyl aminopeptidase/acylaminoacyl peptidase
MRCTSQIPAGHELALVNLRSVSGVIVRDIGDLSNPVTRCVIQGVRGNYFRFVTATRISYIVSADNGDGAMYVADLQTGKTSLVRSWSNGGYLYWTYAWSPDGSMLSYISSGDQIAWHVRSSSGDQTLSALGSIPGRGVDPDRDDAMVGFSADGQYVALEETFTDSGSGKGAPFQVVRLADHKLVYSRTDGSMATWAGKGARLFFRTKAGVESWDPTAGAHLMIPGLFWIRPSPSADGLRIAYTAADGTGNHHVGYMRLADQPPAANQLSFQPRTGAAFLDSTLVWYQQESLCSAAGVQCGLGGAPLTGRTYIRDLVTGTENVSIITALYDSWPRVGAS